MRPLALPARLPATAVLVAVIACGGSGTEPDTAAPGIRFTSGVNVTDTVTAVLPQALTVEVRDERGALVTGAVVRFEAIGAPGPSLGYGYYLGAEALVGRLDAQGRGTFSADTTDASGRARAIVQLGVVAGPARVVVKVPAYAYTDTARYTVQPGKAARITLKVRDTVSIVGRSYSLGAAVSDMYGNARAGDALTYTPASAIVSVDAAGTVKTLSTGRGLIRIRAGTYADSAWISAVPDGTLAAVAQVSGTRSISTLKLDGSALTPLAPITSTVLLPRWNRAGTRVTYYEGDPNSNAQVYEVDLQGTRTHLALTAGPITQYFPRYSPDGLWIYFSGPAPTGSVGVWRAHPDGTASTLLASTQYEWNWEGSPSPDGASIAYIKGGQLATMVLSTGAVTTLGVYGDLPEYSPDGSRIAFRTSSGQLGIIGADGTGLRTITGTQNYDTYTPPSWSPDGKWIVVGGTYFTPDLVNVATSEVIPLTTLHVTQPAFKP